MHLVNIVLSEKKFVVDEMLETGSSQNVLSKQLFDKLNECKLIVKKPQLVR